MIRLAIVDDHDLLRAGIRAILEPDPLFQIVAETGDGQEAIRLAASLTPDVMLMDIHLPGGLSGLDATETIVRDNPGVRVILLTHYENREYIRRALRIGARGYLLKRSAASDLKTAIRTVYGGQRYLHPAVADGLVDLVTAGRSIEEAEDEYERLTPRERQVFTLLAEGKTSRDISKYLSISLKTAMTHRTNVMEKLNMHTRSALIRYAVRKGVLSVDDV
jgi:DNA-binding NarL/FixJ family response regulator